MDHTQKIQITQAETRTPYPRALNAAREALLRAGFAIDREDRDEEPGSAGATLSGVRRVQAPGIVLPYRCSIDVEQENGGVSISSRIVIQAEWSRAVVLILIAIFLPVLPLAIAPSAVSSAIAIAGILAVAGWAIWLNFAGGNAYRALDAEVWAGIQQGAPVVEGSLRRRTDRV